MSGWRFAQCLGMRGTTAPAHRLHLMVSSAPAALPAFRRTPSSWSSWAPACWWCGAATAAGAAACAHRCWPLLTCF